MAEKNIKMRVAKILSFIITGIMIFFVVLSIYGWGQSHSFMYSIIISSGIVITLSTLGLFFNPERPIIYGLLIMIFSILTFCATGLYSPSYDISLPAIFGVVMILGVSVGILTISVHEQKS